MTRPLFLPVLAGLLLSSSLCAGEPPAPLPIGHRGLVQAFPENTLAGLRADSRQHPAMADFQIAAHGRPIGIPDTSIALLDPRPGGIKVRFKIRIATGKRAQLIDARQAKVIMEVLQWQRQQRTRPSGS